MTRAAAIARAITLARATGDDRYVVHDTSEDDADDAHAYHVACSEDIGAFYDERDVIAHVTPEGEVA